MFDGTAVINRHSGTLTKLLELVLACSLPSACKGLQVHGWDNIESRIFSLFTEKTIGEPHQAEDRE